MSNTYSYDLVYDATVRAFDALYTNSRHSIRANWPKMTPAERHDAMRGLVHLRHVGQDPNKYLSRNETEAAWHQRARAFSAQYPAHSAASAYRVVPTPVGVAEGPMSHIWRFANGRGVLGHNLWHDWYTLAETFMHYDYDRTSGSKSYEAQQHAEKLINISERLCDRAAEVKAPCLKRNMLKFIHNFKSYDR